MVRLRRASGLLSAVLALFALSGRARAEALEVGTSLRDVSLGTRVEVLEDVAGTLSPRDALRSERFRRSQQAVPNFGFTSSVYWLRLTVKNTRAEERPWLLELAYPLIDDVALFTPRVDGSGFDARRTGDLRPFSQRDLACRNFAFSLREPPQSQRVYLLRVQSSGSLALPLRAWSMREFIEQQHHDWTMLCIFYGVLLFMAVYSLCMFAATGQREYLPYAGYVVALGIFQFTKAGHTFQYVLPDAPWLVQRMMPVSVLCAQAFAALVVRSGLPPGHRLEPFARGVAWSALLALPPALFISYAVLMPVIAVVSVFLLTVVTLITIALACIHTHTARLFLIGWSGAIAGGVCAALAALGVLPVNFFSKWCTQIGVTLQLVMLASAYADKYNVARAELSALQQRLSQKVSDLSAALVRSEEASQRARHATRLKNEFMATMSHEFRTPLNPIINIPQGVRQEFVEVAGALCTGCRAHFELDEGDRLEAETACPECQRVGTLAPRTSHRFRGDAGRAKALIGKVEHSGRHLLSVVNGILDFSKLQAGHLQLAPERVSVTRLFSELERSVSAQAAQQGRRVTFELPDGDLTLDADPTRALQVLACLTDNALKYSEPGGMVIVRALRAGTSCVFSVRDHGIGIAPENFERIFESFEQVHKGNTRKYGGTGLGLAIARVLVRMHNGELRVQSELGCGSTFSFELPLACAESQAKSA